MEYMILIQKRELNQNVVMLFKNWCDNQAKGNIVKMMRGRRDINWGRRPQDHTGTWTTFSWNLSKGDS